MNNTVKDIISYSAKELEYMADNANALTIGYIISRIINLQGALNVALSQLNKEVNNDNKNFLKKVGNND